MSTKIWIYISNYYFNILYALFVFSYRYCSQYYSVAILYIYVLQNLSYIFRSYLNRCHFQLSSPAEAWLLLLRHIFERCLLFLSRPTQALNL